MNTQSMVVNGQDNYAKKCVLFDVSLLGRHYIIKSTNFKKSKNESRLSKFGSFDSTRVGTKRQYTECFVLREDVYDNLLKLALNPLESHAEAMHLREAMFRNS